VAQSIDDDLKGSAVRLWHLIEDRAQAGEILITDAVRTAIADLKGVGFEPYDGPEVAGSEVNWRLRY
jgi:class 3 adenylate cyclase